MPRIDLNADVGEDMAAPADEAALLHVVTSASVCCGAHAGTPEGVAATVRAAVVAGAVVGAHPSYPDRAGFGRRSISMGRAELAQSLGEQIAFVSGLARAAGSRVHYVKPHGALYHQVSSDPSTAALVAEVVAGCGIEVLLMAAGATATDEAEAAGVRVVGEAFADRAYRADGTLAPRGDPGAVLVDDGTVVAQALSIVRHGRATAADGTVVEVRADSLCLHGDTAGALALARSVRRALEEDGVVLAPFAA